MVFIIGIESPMVDEHAVWEESGRRQDRRRRHADNPSVPITVNLPLRLKQRVDAYVVERRMTRNGVISQALVAWLNARDESEEEA